MQLFFIYDTAYCKADEDDPKDAVVFFYPGQACETQRYALICQLVGVAQFLKSTFSSPSALILDRGKFAFHRNENYLFVLGGNSEIKSAALKKQLLYLCGIFYFYHGNVASILESCGSERQQFLEKMEFIWTHLLTFLQGSDTLSKLSFAAVPLSPLKHQTSISSKASHLLQMCQLSSTVLAGSVFCNNLMLSTQLTSEITSYLTILFNSNASSSACDVSSLNDIPPGVELKYVYLTKKEIENIMNYNHKSVGNVFRVRHSWKSPKSAYSYSGSLNSGSEGDVDSGNCSEINRGKNHQFQDQKSSMVVFHSDPGVLNLNENKVNNFSTSLVNMEEGSVSGNDDSGIHVRREFAIRSISASQNNKTKEPLLNSENVCNYEKKLKDTVNKRHILSKVVPEFTERRERKKSFDYLKTTDSRKGRLSSEKHPHMIQEKASLKFLSTNLICRHHSSYRALKFLSNVTSESAPKRSFSDFEFSCHVCTNDLAWTVCCRQQSLKRWNSEIFASQFVNHGCAEDDSMIQKLRFLNLLDRQTLTKHGGKSSKLQILRCRSKSEHLHRTQLNEFHRHAARKRFSESSKPEMKNLFDCSRKKRNSNAKRNYGSLDMHLSKTLRNQVSSHSSGNRQFQKIILYNQRCGNSNLLLLLNSLCDAKVLNYLWNCGFSVLKDLEQSLKKNITVDCETEPSFHISVYSNVKKTLTDYPRTCNSFSMEKHPEDSVLLHIHEDFCSSRNLCSISLLASDKSVFAQHTKQHCIFYEQPESSSRKLESLCNLSKKAARRIEKCTGIVLKN